jgi:hypothetical protein
VKPPNITPLTDDYDPKQSIQELSNNLMQPDKFADIFCYAAKTQKKIDDVIKENFQETLRKDNDTINAVKRIIQDCNKEDLMSLLKKIGFGIGFGVWTILTIILTAWATRFFSK